MLRPAIFVMIVALLLTPAPAFAATLAEPSLQQDACTDTEGTLCSNPSADEGAAEQADAP